MTDSPSLSPTQSSTPDTAVKVLTMLRRKKQSLTKEVSPSLRCCHSLQETSILSHCVVAG